MTMCAIWNESQKTVTVRTTSGPVTVDVEEYPGHLRSFWHDLGEVLNKAEKKDEE